MTGHKVAARRGGAARGSVARRVAAFLAAALAGAAMHAAPATADEQPSILKAYGLDWIQRVRDDAWPQPKDQRPIICLLDTGVAITPDTPADNPDGPIVARLAIDGGDGLPQGTTFEHLHGTTMASVIAAPKNDWGTVGVFPQARIVSVRVTLGDATYITPSSVRSGVAACRDWIDRQSTALAIGSVVMAESNYDQRPADAPAWQLGERLTEDAGGVFVAAVGNDQSAEFLPPVSVGSVLPVAAGDATGRLCSFAKYPAGTGVLGPGCSESGVDWPAGSSAATAAAGALLGAMSAMRPDIEASGRLDLILSSSSSSTGEGPTLNGSSIAATMFAGKVLPEPTAPPAPVAGQSALSSETQVLPAATAGVSAGTGSASWALRLWRPTVKLRWTRGHMTVSRIDHGPRGALAWDCVVGQRHVLGSASSVTRRVSVRLSDRPKVVDVWVQDRTGAAWRSLRRRARVATS